MRNTRLKRLREVMLRAVGALSLLSLPGASAANDTQGTTYTTAVFAREVQVHTTAWWQSDGSVLPGPRGLLSAPSASGAVFSDYLARYRPRVESLEVTLLYQLTEVVSLYGGGWLLSALEPGSLTPRAAKFGLDFASPWLFLDHRLQPIGAAEVQSQKVSDWSADFSLRAGLRWNDLRAADRSLSLMLEGFVGNTKSTVPGAQQKMDYLGLGLHYGW
jgi:Protein of unknown function (DUF1207)